MQSCLMVTVLLLTLISIILYNFVSDVIGKNSITGNIHAQNKLSNWVEYGFPPCLKPIVLPNAINISDMFEQTKDYEKYINCTDRNESYGNDYCTEFIQERFINYFGQRELECFPPTHIDKHAQGLSNDDTVFTNVSNYLLEDKYDSYSVHTMYQLARSAKEYNDFLGVNNNYTQYRNITNSLYIGTQFFMSRKINTGSPLHYAFGENLFIMLAGKKRWIMLHPNHSYTIGCKMKYGGSYGGCDSHKQPLGNISIDTLLNKIKKHDLREENGDYIDITLFPGDVLLNCETWAHSVENLTPKTFAMSLRFVTFWSPFFTWEIQKWILFDSLITAIKTKLKNWNTFTMLDGLYLTMFTNGPYNYADYDPRFYLSGSKNQKT